MEDNVGKYFIVDGVIKDSAKEDNIDMNRGKKIYEVIRIIDGIPLFFEEHYERMAESFKSINESIGLNKAELKNQIKSLIEANNNKSCNVKFIIFVLEGSQETVGYLSRSYYPSIEEINNGVKLGLLQLERKNPNAKLLNLEYKKTVRKKITEGGYFEVLLVNNEGNITEGSASNVFFVKNNKIYTTPGHAIIKGITRKHILEACKNANYEVVEEFISAEKLDEIEGVFISGTSPKVLPISSIGDKKYSSAKNPVIVAVKDEYDRMIKEDISKNK